MLKEFSCGAIVYKMRDGEPIFLLVNSRRNGLWGFPKGHVEKDESELETAIREIVEETGIRNIKFVENFRQEDIYIMDGSFSLSKTSGVVEKHSVYFLALALEDVLGFDKNEILELRWVNLEQALSLLHFISQKKFISSAYNLIKGGITNE
ncbi:MAG: NUDIX domain-containing protein [Endomicrobium sp.]|jgi:8-oxo-dGTP pyrophosphatase MutT (NUDIX family)|nr:NUDIX domain-containing protein [Endomicrobium sp.]